MQRFAAAAVTVAVATGSLALTATSAGATASTVTVRPGQSIQNAVDDAAPGATIRVAPGTYNESLTITKPVSLVGVGHVVLTPPSAVPVNLCTLDPDAESDEMPGICIAGRVSDPEAEAPSVTEPVTGVRISGLTITGFELSGVEVYGADDLVLDRLRITGNPGGGVFADQTHGAVLRSLTVVSNGSNGINLHRQNSGFTVADSVISGNQGEGLFAGDSEQGVVAHNRVSDNCLGVLLIDLALPGDHGTSAVDVSYNDIEANNRFCLADDEGQPSISGVGVALVGAGDSVVSHNRIRDNAGTPNPQNGEPAMVSFGGLAVLDAAGLTGGAAPSGNTVAYNEVSGNAPFDVLYDGSGFANTFVHNQCLAAAGPGLCRG